MWMDGWMDVGSREGSVGCCTADPGNFQFSASVLMLFPLKLSEKKKKIHIVDLYLTDLFD